MTLKISMMFEQSTGLGRSAGWSETWYADGSLSTPSWSPGFLASARVQFLANSCRVVGARISDLAGGSIIEEIDMPGTRRVGQDIPQMALNISIGSLASVNRKTFQLRGIPDADVTTGDWVPAAGTLAAVNAYIERLGGAGVKYRVKNAAAARVNVIKIEPNGDFLLAPGVVPALNQKIQLMRVRDVNGKNVSGEYLVIDDDSGLPKRLANWQNRTVGTSGTARILGYQYVTCAAALAQVRKITTRKVGRPFFLYRGRATT